MIQTLFFHSDCGFGHAIHTLSDATIHGKMDGIEGRMIEISVYKLCIGHYIKVCGAIWIRHHGATDA